MTASADRAIVGKLARGSLLSRIAGHGRKPLRLTAVPRDHVQGDRARGDALLAGRFEFGNEALSLTGIDFGAVGASGALAEELQGFAWLRDLAAAASREKGARLAEALAGRWLLAHGTRIDDAWRPDLWGQRILFWTAYAPYILSSRDAGYRYLRAKGNSIEGGTSEILRNIVAERVLGLPAEPRTDKDVPWKELER